MYNDKHHSFLQNQVNNTKRTLNDYRIKTTCEQLKELLKINIKKMELNYKFDSNILEHIDLIDILSLDYFEDNCDSECDVAIGANYIEVCAYFGNIFFNLNIEYKIYGEITNKIYMTFCDTNNETGSPLDGLIVTNDISVKNIEHNYKIIAENSLKFLIRKPELSNISLTELFEIVSNDGDDGEGIKFESIETFKNFLKLVTMTFPVVYYPFIYGTV